MGPNPNFVPVGTAHLHTKDDGNAAGEAIAKDTGTVKFISGIEEGDGENKRTGKQILLKSLAVRYHIFQETGVTAAKSYPATVCVCIIKDKYPQASVPAWTDIFVENSPLSFFNLQNSARFKSVYRRIFNIGPSNPNATHESSVTAWNSPPHDEVYKSMNEKIRFDGGTSAVGSAFDCAYYFCWFIDYMHSTSEPSGGDLYTVQYRTRLRYHDM